MPPVAEQTVSEWLAERVTSYGRVRTGWVADGADGGEDDQHEFLAV